MSAGWEQPLLQKHEKDILEQRWVLHTTLHGLPWNFRSRVVIDFSVTSKGCRWAVGMCLLMPEQGFIPGAGECGISPRMFANNPALTLP